jgi:hypothetical protein
MRAGDAEGTADVNTSERRSAERRRCSGPLVRLLQMHDLALLSGGLLWLVQLINLLLPVRTSLEQVGELLLTILTPPAQLLERQELHRRQLVCLG